MRASKGLSYFSLAGFVLALGLSVLSPKAFARTYGPHEGYLDSTDAERTEVVTELVPVEKPAEQGPPLKDRIFNETLTKEFRDRYEEKFGRTDAVRVYYSPNKYTYYDDLYSFHGSVEDDNAEKQKYAQYMMRRLIEYHADNYTKQEVPFVYKAKQQLSETQIGTKNYKFKLKYSISGNQFEMNFENPFVHSQILYEISGVREKTVVISRDLTKTVNLEGRYKNVEGIMAVIANKKISDAVNTNITASTYTNASVISTRERLVIAGITYTY